VLDVVAEPLLSGVYGGDAGSLSAMSVLPRFVQYEREYGSLIRGVRRERKRQPSGSLFLSFRGGMQTIVDALTKSIDGWAEIVTGDATRLEREAGGWRIHIKDGSLLAGDVVLACPAYTSSSLLNGAAPELASELIAIPYSSAILVTLLYERPKMNHPLDGFGFLVPRSERHHVAAATWISTKFPSRTPNHRAALRAFIVGADAVELQTDSDEHLVEIVRDEFKRLMGLHAEPIRQVVNRWPRSMPQYVVGHADRCNRIRELVTNLAGLYLAGNAYSGVGIPDCVRLGKETANQITVTRKASSMAKT
jgi:protoporphyrinogen/coproporphyrinogen III oxidase